MEDTMAEKQTQHRNPDANLTRSRPGRRGLTLYGFAVWACSRILLWLTIITIAIICTPALIYQWLKDHEPARYRRDR